MGVGWAFTVIKMPTRKKIIRHRLRVFNSAVCAHFARLLLLFGAHINSRPARIPFRVQTTTIIPDLHANPDFSGLCGGTRINGRARFQPFYGRHLILKARFGAKGAKKHRRGKKGKPKRRKIVRAAKERKDLRESVS